MAVTLKQLLDQTAKEGNPGEYVDDAVKWFKDRAEQVQAVEGTDDDGTIKNISEITGSVFIGAMFMFYYYPKHIGTLPIYDQFPLVFPIELYQDGFLGLNLHYLDRNSRAGLMDALYSLADGPIPIKDPSLKGAGYRDLISGRAVSKPQQMDETRLNIAYRILKNASKFDGYQQCVKRYLYPHIGSNFYFVPSSEWQIALFLPTEKFIKNPKYYSNVNKAGTNARVQHKRV